MEVPANSETNKPALRGPVEGNEEIIEPSAKLNTDDPAKSEAEDLEMFQSRWRLLAAFTSIAIDNLAIALNATVISVPSLVSIHPSNLGMFLALASMNNYDTLSGEYCRTPWQRD